ncbi:STAS domain-containing protein [Paenibacillus rigui]|nr:STAS domain-containing protein [Paenibacillus rigui]
MNISETIHEGGDITIVTIEGRLDANTSSVLESRFVELTEQGRRKFVFELQGLEYVSSAGLRSLLLAAKKTKTLQGKLALAGMNENVREVFDMSGFSAIFSIYGTEAEALAAVQGA